MRERYVKMRSKERPDKYVLAPLTKSGRVRVDNKGFVRLKNGRCGVDLINKHYLFSRYGTHVL